jgi:hypothetical protein
MPTSKRSRSSLAGLAVCLFAPPSLAQESFTEGLARMVTDGKVGLNLRYRYEFVDQDGFDVNANASTLRSRLSLASASNRGFSFLTEFDNVSYIGNDNFNSTTNGKTQYPVVADPSGTEVNQAWLKYNWQEFTGTYGRQRIALGDQRFIGGVAWRQNEQTYDGFRAQWQSSFGLSADYAYVYNINRIFGPEDSVAQPANWHGNNNFLRLDYTLTEQHTFTAFTYLLDIDDRSGWSPNKSVNNSTDTYGVEYNGQVGPVTARAAYAWQSDAGDSQLDYDARYYVLEGKMAIAGITGQLGYEVLGSDNGVGFNTPLATLHKFQGWADKFLITPANGIKDLYIGAYGGLGPVQLAAIWHDFQAEEGSDDYGSEIDLSATWPIDKMLSLQLTYANFNSDDSALYQDTQKLWLTLNLVI